MKAEFGRSAKSDIRRAAAFYGRQRFELGMQFTAEVDYWSSYLADHPKLGMAIDPTYRCLQMRRFPYALIYRIEKHRQIIRITAVIHHSRRPGFWRGRAKEPRPIYLAA